jgi:hypothetical protein
LIFTPIATIVIGVSIKIILEAVNQNCQPGALGVVFEDERGQASVKSRGSGIFFEIVRGQAVVQPLTLRKMSNK